MDNPNFLYNHLTTLNTIILIFFISFNYKFTFYYIYLFLNLFHYPIKGRIQQQLWKLSTYHFPLYYAR